MKQRTKTPLEKLVLLILADCHNEASGMCFPSISFLCERAMCSRQGAINVLVSLEEQGLISARKSSGKSTHYELHTSQQSVPVNRVDPSTECTGTSQLSRPVPVNCVDPTSQLSRPEPGINRELNREEEPEEAASRPLSTEKTTRPTPVPSPTKTPQCPQEEILALYHEILPEMTVHRDWTPTRRKHLAARWASDTRRQNLDYWRDLFEWIRESDFLMGRVTGIGGKPFRCSLEWIVNQSNFTKITERKYHEDRAA